MSIMAEVLAVKNGIVLPPALEVAAAKAGREVPAQPDALPTVLVLVILHSALLVAMRSLMLMRQVSYVHL